MSKLENTTKDQFTNSVSSSSKGPDIFYTNRSVDHPEQLLSFENSYDGDRLTTLQYDRTNLMDSSREENDIVNIDRDRDRDHIWLETQEDLGNPLLKNPVIS